MRQKGTRMISAFLLCLALTLSGCSTQPPAESDSTPPSSSADSSAAEENQVAASPEEGVEIATNNCIDKAAVRSSARRCGAQSWCYKKRGRPAKRCSKRY